MAQGFQCRLVAQISLQNINNQANPLGQVLTIGGPGNPATISVPLIGAATTEAAAVAAALTALGTAISAAVLTPFTNELIAQETGGG